MWNFATPLAFLLLPLAPAAMRLLPGRRAVTGALMVPPAIGRVLAAGSSGTAAARARLALPIVLWCSLVTALAGPQRLEPVAALPMTGRDLVLAIDMSGSMTTEDFRLAGRTVSRLDAVKAVGRAFVERRAGDRVGLVLFAEEAYVAAPLTFDVAAVAHAIDEAAIGISGRSTAIAGGLGAALKRLKDSKAASRVVVLLSDGSDTSGTVEPGDAAALARQLGVKVYTIALGPQDLETSPSARDAVDTAMLRKIAEASGGTTFRVEDTDDLEAVTGAIDRLEASGFDRPAVSVNRDYWPWPAILAFACAAWIIASRRMT